jgi:hypothetical protein
MNGTPEVPHPHPHPGWTPSPSDTSAVELPAELLPLVERLAENAHDNWADLKLSQGWQWGVATEPAAKRHHLLVPYSELSEEDKEPDRRLAVQTLKLVLCLGFEIVQKPLDDFPGVVAG